MPPIAMHSAAPSAVFVGPRHRATIDLHGTPRERVRADRRALIFALALLRLRRRGQQRWRPRQHPGRAHPASGAGLLRFDGVLDGRRRLRSSQANELAAVTQHQIVVNGAVARLHGDRGSSDRAQSDDRRRGSLVLLCRVHAAEPGSGNAPGHLLLQRRPGLGDDMAASRLVRPEAPRDRRSVDHGSDAVSAGRQRRDAARRLRPRVRRRGGHGPLRSDRAQQQPVLLGRRRRRGASSATSSSAISRQTTARARRSSCSESRTARRAPAFSRSCSSSPACA